MRIFRHLPSLRLEADVPRVLTLGNFDGVHVGHQEIIRRAVAQARRRGGTAVALTFHPHPLSVLAPQRAPLLISTLRERMVRLRDCGIDVVILQHFTPRFAAVDAQTFLREMVVGRIGACCVVVGENVGFGQGRGGDAELLQKVGPQLGFDVEIVSRVRLDDTVVSSSAVRKAIAAGDLERAARLLGRPFGVCGRVIPGHRRGQQIGVPTANLRVSGLQLPPDGVYAVRVQVGDRWWDGVANLGPKPTFDDFERGLEAHLFGYQGDLYRRHIYVTLVRRLRGERRFPSPEALAEQIRRDITEARRVLARDD